MSDDATPVLVGCGQVTQREPDPAAALEPVELMAEAGRRAAEDTGAGRLVIDLLDTIVILRSFSDTSWRFTCPFGRYANPPASVARRLGADGARRLVYTHPGGNMPQWCINRLFEMITRGEVRAALVCGGEALATQKAAQRAGLGLDWSEDPGGSYEEWGIARRGWSDMEDRHRMAGAIFAYPLIENAIRGHRGRSIDEHARAMGELFAGFAAVAAANPLADRRAGYSSDEIATVGPGNPYIGFPYTRLMNANAFIDQSAAVVLTSRGEARRLGIADDRLVYLHGCADAHDHWYLSDRRDLHSSPAMATAGREAMEMAGCTIGDIDYLDLYSCFPSAVEIACDELGLAADDPRGLTVTGGLPYFGGPGNNYVTHSIAEMMNRVRVNPGSLGMVTANGNYVTKQSIGIYSSEPGPHPFSPRDPAVYQAEIDAEPGPWVSEHAEGRARVETYTVMHDRTGPSFGIMFGRLGNDSRFIAVLPEDRALLSAMTEQDHLGVPGQVRSRDGVNRFVPD